MSLERILQVLFGEDRKSMLGYYFSVLANLIPHKFDFALHASPLMFYLYSMFLLFLIIYIYIYIYLGVKMKGILFFLFLAYQILHVFLFEILVHCTLIDYAFI
jgi:hypothetical protein